jgi:hypothetical protein
MAAVVDLLSSHQMAVVKLRQSQSIPEVVEIQNDVAGYRLVVVVVVVVRMLVFLTSIFTKIPLYSRFIFISK